MILISILFIIPYSLSEEWTVHVYTGNARYAGTDSNVFIRLFNSKRDGYSAEYQLTHENWIIGSTNFPFKNLFETGGHDRFRIVTEKIGFVENIQVRRDNFPSIRSDWFLDQIIVERNRDSAKFTFKCNCWLRKERPFITIPILSDLRPINKNTVDDSSLTNKQSVAILLIILIVFITCIICCIHQYYHRSRSSSLEYIHHEPSILNRYHPASAPPLLIDTIDRWKTIRHTLPPNTIPVQTIIESSLEEPPAYTDLFPDSNTL